MPPGQDHLDRIEALCRRTSTAKALREDLVAVLRQVMPFDGYVFPLTDPTTLVATSPLADVPGLAWSRLPELIRWRYLTLVNRWDRLLESKQAAPLLAGGPPDRSAMWAHVQRELGIVDSLHAAFGDRYGCWGWLELLRTSAAFTADETSFLTRAIPLIATGLRQAVSRTFVATGEQPVPVGPAVVVLGPDLQVRGQTVGAAAALLALNPPDEPMAPIPAAAYNIGAALIASEESIPVGPPWSRVHLGAGHWVTVKADRIGEDIAVSIETSTAPERTELFARAHGLSARESEVLELVGSGLETKEMATRLVVSEHTVNDHVKSVLAKTGTRTRQQVIARTRSR